jgi:2-alkenal reductase
MRSKSVRGLSISSLFFVLVGSASLRGEDHDLARVSRAQLAESRFLSELNHHYRKIRSAVTPSLVSLVVLNVKTGDMGSGAGWVFREDGIIVTAAHVIGDGDAKDIRILCQFHDGTHASAEILGRDKSFDVGVLKIKDSENLALERADSRLLEPGDQVFGFGSPLGLNFSMTAGIVSSVNRSLSMDPRLIQIDADINQGHSGGPLVDIRGRIVGMILSIKSINGGSVGIAFALPTRMIDPLVAQILEHGEVRPGFLGISYPMSQSTGAAHLHQIGHFGPGVPVTKVDRESPAEIAGLKVGDIILSVNGYPVRRFQDLRAILHMHPPYTEIDIVISRDGCPETLYARLHHEPSSAEQNEIHSVLVAKTETQ